MSVSGIFSRGDSVVVFVVVVWEDRTEQCNSYNPLLMTVIHILSLMLCIIIHTDVKDASIVLADETLKFTGKSENKEYEVDIAFFKPVDANGSTYKVLPRSVQMHVMKKDKSEGEFWPRLLQDKILEKNQVSQEEVLSSMFPRMDSSEFNLLDIICHRSKSIGIDMWMKMKRMRDLTPQL